MITAYWKQYFVSPHSSNFSFKNFKILFQMTWNCLLAKRSPCHIKMACYIPLIILLQSTGGNRNSIPVFNRSFPHSNPVRSRMLFSKMLCNRKSFAFSYKTFFFFDAWKWNSPFFFKKNSKMSLKEKCFKYLMRRERIF